MQPTDPPAAICDQAHASWVCGYLGQSRVGIRQHPGEQSAEASWGSPSGRSQLGLAPRCTCQTSWCARAPRRVGPTLRGQLSLKSQAGQRCEYVPQIPGAPVPNPSPKEYVYGLGCALCCQSWNFSLAWEIELKCSSGTWAHLKLPDPGRRAAPRA